MLRYSHTGARRKRAEIPQRNIFSRLWYQNGSGLRKVRTSRYKQHMAASVPDPAITPQAYLQPIGLSPVEANAVLEVAARNNGAVQWQRPP
ncbi:MAG: hypothetical protein JSR49_15815, partial [Proteobacteria bacterium]|nr:hypothetical protein [Pseudomonadota bacterium]